MIRKFLLPFLALAAIASLSACGDDDETAQADAVEQVAEDPNLPEFELVKMRLGMTTKEAEANCPSKYGESGFPLYWQDSFINGLEIYICPLRNRQTVYVFADQRTRLVSLVRYSMETAAVPFGPDSQYWSVVTEKYGAQYEIDAAGQYFWPGKNGSTITIENLPQNDGRIIHRVVLATPAALDMIAMSD